MEEQHQLLIVTWPSSHVLVPVSGPWPCGGGSGVPTAELVSKRAGFILSVAQSHETEAGIWNFVYFFGGFPSSHFSAGQQLN